MSTATKPAKRVISAATAALVWLSLATAAFSDTLILSDGSRVNGYYEGGTSRVVRFRTAGGVRDYDLLSVHEILFDETGIPQTAAPVEAPRVSAASSPRAEATAAYTIPRGSTLLVRMVDAIDSEESQTGQTFRAALEEPLLIEGTEVVPAYAEVRGRIVEADDAGRLRGSAELRLELTQIVVNSISYAVATSEYEEVGEGRGAQTATRVGAGAGAGALIGLIVGGGKGAAIGAGIGAGTAGAVQVLTKGEKLYIPAETLLEFSLREPLVVATR